MTTKTTKPKNVSSLPAHVKKRIEEAEHRAEVERAARLDHRWTDTVAKLDKLACDPKTLGPALRKLADVDPRTARALHRALRDVNDAVLVPLAVAKTPEQKLTVLAKARAAKENITFEKAYADVTASDTGRQLYRQYVEEREHGD